MNECEEDCGYCGACLEEHEYQRRIEDESKEERHEGQVWDIAPRYQFVPID